MNRILVASNSIASVGYDADTSTLEVEFKKGAVHQYFGVPERIYQGLVSAGSKGTYVTRTIKPNYKYLLKTK